MNYIASQAKQNCIIHWSHLLIWTDIHQKLFANSIYIDRKQLTYQLFISKYKSKSFLPNVVFKCVKWWFGYQSKFMALWFSFWKETIIDLTNFSNQSKAMQNQQ